MDSSLTRRELVAAAGAVSVGAVAAKPIAASPDDPCAEVDRLEAEIDTLEGELAELEALIEELPTRRWELFLELPEIFGNLREPRYPPHVRDTARDIGESIRDNVLLLDVISEFGDGFATAWVVDDGYLLTNAHNVEGNPDEVRVMNPDGADYGAEIVNYVEGNRPDVALLETEYPGQPLPIGTSSDLDPGDHLLQVGHPGNFGYWVISLGEFVEFRDDNRVQATVPGLAGNSGSPILNFSGEVVAMTHAGTHIKPEETPHTGDPVTDAFTPPTDTLAVPIETAMERMETWR